MATRTAKDLGELQVRDVMCAQVRVVAPDATIAEAARLFEEKHFHHVVVERNGKRVGIVSDRDILPLVRVPQTRSCGDPAMATLVSEVMTRRVETVASSEPIAGAIIRMLERGVNALVVTERGKTVGILTSTDFLTLLLDRTVDGYVAAAKPARSRPQPRPAPPDKKAVKLSRRTG